MATYIIGITWFYQNCLHLWLYYMLELIWLYCKNMQNLENMDVFEILITQKLLKCPKDPFVRSALICKWIKIIACWKHLWKIVGGVPDEVNK